MYARSWIGLGAALVLAAPAAVLAQGPAYSADEIANMLGGGSAGGPAASAPGDVAFSADQIAAMLAPGSGGRPLTRGLRPGEGPATAGTPDRPGVIPDLQVNFGFNSATIQPKARAQLDELGKALQFEKLRGLRFTIGGHTDAVGDPSLNERLSERRANAVVSYLTQEFDIDPDRLRAEGHGESQLMDPARPSSGVNRRVEVRSSR